VYDDDWLNEMRNGKGTLRYANGDVYEGYRLEDNSNGTGANGNVYEGDWLDEKRNGKGTLRYANGDVS
jgi:hypothetical protein